MDFERRYGVYFERFESYLNDFISALDGEKRLEDAIKYSLLGGGKRIRPVLALAFADLLGVKVEKILPFALATELIHTSSLIHDDLPALDNDDLRRGRPSNHKVYGEGLAVIAGDATLNLAYELLFSVLNGEREAKAAEYLAEAAGYKGMLGGQSLDIAFSTALDERSLLSVDMLKTCKLITAPIVVADILAGGDGKEFEEFGNDLGLLFQFVDDYLDEFGDSAKLGKSLGKDKSENKLTALSVYGQAGSKEKINELCAKCVEFLRKFENSEFLTDLVRSIAEREK